MSIVSRRNREISDFLFKWLSSIFTKYPVILEDQHEPRPLGPHLSFKFLTNFIRQGGADEIVVDKVTGERTMRGFRVFTVSVKAVGNALEGSKASHVRAVDLLGHVQWELEKPENYAQFQAAGVGIIEAMNIVDTTDLEENVYIPRAVLDIRMSCQISERLTQAFVESVNISGSSDTDIGPFSNKPQP